MLSRGVCTTRHRHTSGRLMQELNVCTTPDRNMMCKKLSVSQSSTRPMLRTGNIITSCQTYTPKTFCNDSLILTALAVGKISLKFTQLTIPPCIHLGDLWWNHPYYYTPAAWRAKGHLLCHDIQLKLQNMNQTINILYHSLHGFKLAEGQKTFWHYWYWWPIDMEKSYK